MDSTYEEAKRELHEVFLRIKRGHLYFPDKVGDLTSTEIGIVVAIAHAARRCSPVRPGMIAHLRDISPSALSQTLKSLERKGYLIRERLGEDSRGVSLALTDAGQRAAAEGARLRDGYMRALFDYLGEEDVEDLIRVFKRMAVFFDEGQGKAQANGEASSGAGAQACGAGPDDSDALSVAGALAAISDSNAAACGEDMGADGTERKVEV